MRTQNAMPSRSHEHRPHDETLLPLDFSPCPYSVVCGRGKLRSDVIGNRRLTVTASLFLDRYDKAESKAEKGAILSEIISVTRRGCPHGRGAFVKLMKGRWWEVNDVSARDKVGAVLRSGLQERYHSSKISKVAVRKSRCSEQHSALGFCGGSQGKEEMFMQKRANLGAAMNPMNSPVSQNFQTADLFWFLYDDYPCRTLPESAMTNDEVISSLPLGSRSSGISSLHDSHFLFGNSSSDSKCLDELDDI